MKSIFDPSTRNELIARINSLSANHHPQWGKMTIHEMIRHMTIWNEWVLGKHPDHNYKQGLLGKIFGKMALKANVKDNTSMKKGMPAGKFFLSKGFKADLESQKSIWIQHVADYGNFSNPRFLHDFFGVMTPDQIGIFAYKHADHHLRQFGV